MSKEPGFTTEYKLDKTFFAECYDQTSLPTQFPKAYLKGILFLIFGVVLLEFELLPNGYVGWFFIVLSVIEAFSVYCKRTWWLWRQRISSGAGSKIVFQGDANGVSYKTTKRPTLSRGVTSTNLSRPTLVLSCISVNSANM